MNGLLRAFATGPDRPLIADQGRIDTLFRSYRMRVMLAITVGYAFAYTCRLALSVVKKPLIDAGIFSPTDLGLIGSALFYSYALGKLVNGFLADHANIKRLLRVRRPGVRADQHRHGFLDGALGVGRALGAERLVPGLRRAVRRRLARAVVQQPRARPLLRHLEHGAFDRRRADFRRVGAFVGCVRLARRASGARVCCASRRPRRSISLHAGPAAHAGPADGRRLAQRSLRGLEAAHDAPRGSVLRQQLSILAIPAIWVLAVSSALDLRDALRDQQLGRALPAGERAATRWSRPAAS